MHATMDPEESIVTQGAGARLALMAESFVRLTGKSLVEASPSLAQALWSAPRAIVAHGTEADPIFFYGNRMALDLFEMPASDFLRLPSHLSAEAPSRAERARLLERVRRDGYIADYAGVRISAGGRRFRIEQATVWMLIDDAGHNRGQAATFSQWVWMD
jgi:hypothetical protein